MLPVVGFISVNNIRMVVLLPAPFCPKKPYTSPLFTVNDKLFTAVKSLNFLERLSTLITTDMKN